jgi:hypothetical protein
MGRVQVVNDDYRREGAEAGQPFSSFMSGINDHHNEQFAAIHQQLAALSETNALQNQRIAALSETNALQNQRIAAQDETNALQNQRIANLTERSNEYAVLLDDAARAHNELQDTINYIRQRNADLTIDQGAIDILRRAHDFAMCPLCREQYRATFCIPCMHAVCSDCCPAEQHFCPVCSVHIALRYDLPY